MSRKKLNFTRFLSFLLIVSITLMNVNVAFADDDPTPEPVATEAPTEESAQPPVEVTATPIVATPIPEETSLPQEEAPAEEVSASVLAKIPENTELVVLNENGEAVSLASQEAADIILDTDPMWCPAGILPGGAGCTTNFATITALLTDMRNNTNTYDEHGVIYFTASPGSGTFALTTAGTSLGVGDYNTLKNFNLTLQGGWNGSTVSPTFIAQTNFGNTPFTIGESGNPWVGNITLTNFAFNNVSSSNAVAVYTTTGNITLNNVDVVNQNGGTNTALLQSNSGNIVVQNGSSFDGNNGGLTNRNRGFSATTNSGSITISGTSGSPISFNEAGGLLSPLNSGATLTAPTVSLNYVTANNNWLNGITINANTTTLTNVTATNSGFNGVQINNAATVNLNNVTASNNGINILGLGLGSGVNVNGTGATSVNINGGIFNNNAAYGVSVFNGTLQVTTPMTSCTGNGQGCTNDAVPPVLTLPTNITVEATGPSGTIVTFSATAADNVDGARTVTCNPTSGIAFPITTTTVICSASDTRGNTVNGSFTVTVQDTIPPTLILPANIIEEATSPSGAVVTYSASANDIVDGARTVICIPASGSIFPITTTTVNCSASDTRGNTANGSFTVTVQDTTPPILTLPADITVEATGPSGAVVTYSVSATDIADPSVSIICSDPSGSTFPVGTTTVTCTATDDAGNSTSGSFNVTVQDTTPPVLTLPADITVEATGPSGAVVTYLVTATDIVDLSVSIICSDPSGSTFPLGTTTVTCVATDNAGNSISGSFNITVQDTTPPVLTLPADITAEATGPAGAVVTYSVTATDIVDLSVSIICSDTSGDIFPISTTVVTCTATDDAGNSTSGSFNITVQDTTPPVLTLPADIAVEATSASGTIVTYSVSATDVVDVSVLVICSDPSGSTFPISTTVVTCTATDNAGNSTSGSFNITVQDTTPPVIDPVTNLTRYSFNGVGKYVTYSIPASSDIVDGAVLVTCVPPPGSFLLLGVNSVTCSATDSHGNTASVSFIINVVDVHIPAPVLSAFGFGIIPITGGELIDLACFTVVNAFDIKVTFYNLCEHQAVITAVESNTLPGQLPDGYSLVKGLNVTVLFDGQVTEPLPDNTGIQMDFPIPAKSQDQYAVLFWHDEDGDGNGEWLEVTHVIKSNELAKILSEDAEDELYKIEPTNLTAAFYQTLTAGETGTFIIVKK